MQETMPNPLSLIPLIFLSIIGSLVWFALYFATRRMFSHKCTEFSSRIVACIHAISMTILCLLCLKQGPNPLDGGEGESNTWLQIFTMLSSLSYFVYDLCWCLYYQTEPIIMLLHHVASIISLGCILAMGLSGAEAVAGLGSMEVTNPLLQARWFLRTAGYNRTPIHTLVEVVFIVMFVAMRLVYGSRLTYTMITSNKVPWQVKTCTGALFLISITFLYHIFEFVKRKYIDRSGTHCHPIICEPDIKDD
ncbi:TLC domain-containing protein 5 [Nilaparvata lugens]|uniref:TLC domain-containing protein 5 n=1 Tax=Nilaparvata lugens TaxID=108931 RepID=UPI00193DE1EA|nr:TLC domain-containing protein 5 [Nilaparvata lugens]XP_039285185.1 TLC domain-containing protein 5 [Nilaparvata lugens]